MLCVFNLQYSIYLFFRFFFFFFIDPATTEIYTLSLHDALPICPAACRESRRRPWATLLRSWPRRAGRPRPRSEEHTSELQSRLHIVCRLLLEKKKKNKCIKHTVKKIDTKK